MSGDQGLIDSSHGTRQASDTSRRVPGPQTRQRMALRPGRVCATLRRSFPTPSHTCPSEATSPKPGASTGPQGAAGGVCPASSPLPPGCKALPNLRAHRGPACVWGPLRSAVPARPGAPFPAGSRGRTRALPLPSHGDGGGDATRPRAPLLLLPRRGQRRRPLLGRLRPYLFRSFAASSLMVRGSSPALSS